MDYSLQIQKILVKAETQTNADDKIKLFKQALQLADAHNDVEWGFDLRKELIGIEKETSRCIEGLPAITWIIETTERHSDLFDDTEFMLEYKWMLQAACRNADITAEQLSAILDDYKSRLQSNGYSLHSYYRTLAQLAFMTGKLDDAREYIALREKEDHDDLSFCVACEINDKAELEFRSGNIENGLMIANDLFSQKEWCKYVPFETISNSINILFNNGYGEKAAELFTIADTILHETPEDRSRIGYIAELIKYLSVVNIEKAWEYFEKYADDSINCEDYYAFLFASRVLQLFTTGGQKLLAVSPDMPWHRPDNIYNTTDLYNYYQQKSHMLAKRFDNRHASKHFTNQLVI